MFQISQFRNFSSHNSNLLYAYYSVNDPTSNSVRFLWSGLLNTFEEIRGEVTSRKKEIEHSNILRVYSVC